ncbi:MAG TPA: glycosyltransferase family 2 protein [Thermoanaerobaculia bacterium]|nr:glycosyltransferase family 2 protein [Thermoanaerobaculia bacterium]
MTTNATATSPRVFVIIPAFNEESVLPPLVSELAGRYDRVVVIDDGSGDGTAEAARRAGAVVLRHLINRGQGAALQTGIEWALRKGADVVVTFDADGQHRTEDVGRLLDALDEQHADVAIGSRFLDLRSDVPPLRRAVLLAAIRFMRLTSGVSLTDAHNGLRALRREAAEKIRIRLDRMAHASEIVDQIREHRLRVVEVPVVVRYSDYSRRKGQSSLAAFRIAFDYLMQRWFR